MKMIKKAVIFCGGKATRFNNGKPDPLKPLIKVNSEPILLKIFKIYSSKGVNNFILLGGYKYQELKNFFKKKKIITYEYKFWHSMADRFDKIKLSKILKK